MRTTETLSILQKIINLTWQQSGNDITKLARWIRCLFSLTISYDEETSLKCVEQATLIASERHGVRCPVAYVRALTQICLLWDTDNR
jgi:hypothetical protein